MGWPVQRNMEPCEVWGACLRFPCLCHVCGSLLGACGRGVCGVAS